ncbi:uncharacterized protein KZ484_003030 [Pholidichthys leucotaenia]
MSCCAVGCMNRWKDGLHFYRIPSTSTPVRALQRRLWLKALRRRDWTEESIQNWRVCSSHFISGKVSMNPEDPDFVPSVFDHIKESKKLKSLKQIYRRRRAEGLNSSDSDTSISETSASSATSDQQLQPQKHQLQQHQLEQEQRHFNHRQQQMLTVFPTGSQQVVLVPLSQDPNHQDQQDHPNPGPFPVKEMNIYRFRIKLPLKTVSVKGEDDEDKQGEEPPLNPSANGSNCGGPEPSMNPEPITEDEGSDYFETEVSIDDYENDNGLDEDEDYGDDEDDGDDWHEPF